MHVAPNCSKPNNSPLFSNVDYHYWLVDRTTTNWDIETMKYLPIDSTKSVISFQPQLTYTFSSMLKIPLLFPNVVQPICNVVQPKCNAAFKLISHYFLFFAQNTTHIHKGCTYPQASVFQRSIQTLYKKNYLNKML